MRPLGTHDLFVLVLLVAAHFAVCKLAVDYRHHWIFGLLVLTPIAITALFQMRFQLSIVGATSIHYPLCLAWGFFHGVTYSVYWNRVPHGPFERDSVGLDSPFHYGLFCMQVWAVFGIGSTALYGIGGWAMTHAAGRSVSGNNKIGEPDDARESPS